MDAAANTAISHGPAPAAPAASARWPAQPIVLYHSRLSGHAHRVRLFLSLLGLPFEIEEMDLRTGAHRAPSFLALNAFGQLPVIRDGDVVLADSVAILQYLNARYAPDPTVWMPADPLVAAQVQRWFSVAAGQLVAGPGTARVIQLFGMAMDPADPIARSHKLLKVMDAHLLAQPFLAGPRPTLADLSLCTYVAHAPEGNVSLEPYLNVRAWLGRVEAIPGFVHMVRSPVGLHAPAA